MPEQIFNDPVVIDSGVDEPQLTIRGSGDAGSEQTSPLQNWQTSDAVDQARVTGDGRFQIGTFSGGTMATDDSLIEAHRSETDTGKPKRGIHLLGAITDPLASIISWIVQELVLKGTSGISALHTALRVRLTNQNTGDMTGAELLGGDIEVSNDGGHSSTNGKVPMAAGLRVGLTNQSGGYLQTGVGLQVEMANLGVADTLIGIDVPDVDEGTDNYALRTGAGKVQLGELGAGLVKSNANGLMTNVAATTDPDVEMVGATDTVDGATGLVPQPLAGDEEKFLRGDGLWAVPPGTGGGSAPTGAIMPYAGASAPSDWLMCDGTAVSRTTYAALLAIIGDVFKQFTSLATRTSDTSGTADLGYSSHGLTTSNATLTLRFALANAVISTVNTTSDVITTSAAHLLETGDKVQVSSTATMPGGLSASTDYYVRFVTSTTLTLHPTLADAQNNTNLINLTSAGTGTHTIIPQDEASRTGVPITNVSGSVLTFSGGSGHILPVVGTAISVECDSGMFFLPDMRGRVAVGGGQGNGLTNRSRGDSFGEEDHQLTETELAAHQHNFLGLEDGTDTAGFNAVYRAKWTRDVSGTSTNRFSTAYMQASGGNTPHNNMQPSLVLNYIIKS